MKSRKTELTFILSATLLILVVLGFTGGLNMASFQKNYTESLVSGHAVLGGETVRNIEYAVKYGKPITNFHGMEDLLRDIVDSAASMEEAVIALPDGIVIYNQAGVVTGRQWNGKLLDIARFGADTGGQTYTYLLQDGSYHVFMPIHDRDGAWIGNLGMIFGEQVVKDAIKPYMLKLAVYLLLCALTALLFLLLAFFRYSFVTENGGIHKKRLLITFLSILSVVQVAYGVVNYQMFRDAYVDTAKDNTALVASIIRNNVETVVARGVPYDRLYQVDDYMQRIVDSVPQIAGIDLRSTDSSILYSAGESGPDAAASAGADYAYIQPLPADPAGMAMTLQVDLSKTYINGKLKEIILDALTVLVTSVLFMVEITLLVILFMNKQLRRSFSSSRSKLAGADTGEASATLQSGGGTEDDGDKALVRPVAFILFMAIFMSTSFIPVVMKQLYEPLLGLSPSLVLGLPISAEMLLAGLATIAAGYLIDYRGWKPVFFLGLGLFLAGTLLSGLAWNPLSFIAARGVVGAGYGFALMALRGYVNSTKDEKLRGQGVSALFSGLYAGLNCGVIVGAMLADRIGFSQVFFTALGIAAVAGGFAWLLLPNQQPLRQALSAAASAGKGKLGEFLAHPKILAFFLLILIPTAVCGMFLDYFFPVFAEEVGVSASNVGRAFLLNGLCIVYLGPILSKYFLGRLGPEKSILTAGLIIVISMIVFAVQGTIAAAFTAVILLGIADSFGLVAQNNYFLKLEATGRIGTGKALGYYGNIRKLGQMLGPMVFGGAAALGLAGVGLIGLLFLAALAVFLLSLRQGRNRDMGQGRGLQA